MAEKITITNKATHAVTSVSGNELSLSALSVVTMPLSHNQVKSLARSGNDLVVTTASDQTIVVHGFFMDDPNGHSSLVLRDQGGLWLSDLSSFDALPLDGSVNPADGGVFSSIDSTSPLLDPSAIAPEPPPSIPNTSVAAADSAGTAAAGAASDTTAAITAPNTAGGADMPVTTTWNESGGSLNWLPMAFALGSFATALSSANSASAAASLHAPAITAIGQNSVSAIDSFATHANALTFSGTLDQPLADGQTLKISLDSGKTWNPVTDVNGTQWSYDNTAHTLPDGIYVVQVHIVDASGNDVSAMGVQQFEVSATGTLNLSLQDVLTSAHALTSAGSEQQVMVSGGGDVVSAVHLTEGVGTGASQWQDTGPTTVNGVTYDIYHNSGVGTNTAVAELLIQQGIVVS